MCRGAEITHREVPALVLFTVVSSVVDSLPDKDLNTLGEAELMENVASGYRDAQDPMISSIAQQQGVVERQQHSI